MELDEFKEKYENKYFSKILNDSTIIYIHIEKVNYKLNNSVNNFYCDVHKFFYNTDDCSIKYEDYAKWPINVPKTGEPFKEINKNTFYKLLNSLQ